MLIFCSVLLNDTTILIIKNMPESINMQLRIVADINASPIVPAVVAINNVTK